MAFASDRDATPAQRESNRSGDAIFTGLSLYVMRADGSDVGMLLEGDDVLPVSWRGRRGNADLVVAGHMAASSALG